MSHESRGHMLTLADRITLARLGLAPAIVAAYVLLPVEYSLCFWGAGLLCAIAETSDYLDGRVARMRGEVSDFGKLADPFCDVVYRISVFIALLLPAGGVGYAVATRTGDPGPDLAAVQALVFAVGRDGAGAVVLGAGMVPWLPVLLMVMRELLAGALRAMTAAKGLVLAARTSGKVKAWVQGFALITMMAFPAVWWTRADWHLTYAYWITWICAALSIASLVEYIWVNRAILHSLANRTP